MQNTHYQAKHLMVYKSINHPGICEYEISII